MYDGLGRRVHGEPPAHACEYCGGEGQVDRGSILLPAESREEIIRRQGV